MFRRLAVICLLLIVVSLADARIVFQSNREDRNHDIYVMDDDGSNLQRLTHSRFADTDPVWSRDGAKIAFSRVAEDNQKADIFIMNSDGSAPENLTNHPTLNVAPSWSPDGRHIAFISDRDESLNIYRLDVQSQKVVRLTHNKKLADGGADFPSFSPDGKQIVYTQSTPGNWRTIHIMRADGTGQRAFIPSDGLYRTFPRWSPDGKKIMFGEINYGENLRIISAKIIIQRVGFRDRRVLKTPRNWFMFSACWMGNEKSVLIAAKDHTVKGRKFDIYRYNLATDEMTNLTNFPGSDYAPDWINDSVLDVSPADKKSTTWGTLKHTTGDRLDAESPFFVFPMSHWTPTSN